jgi:hypothetical protein
MCLLRTGITEDEESTMARFLVGLNKPIADKVDMTSYTCLTDLVHLAKRAERQIATSYKYNAHGIIINSKGMSRLNSNSKELQCSNHHLVEQIDLFQLLPNNWM